MGDAVFEQFQKDYRVIDDEEINAYLRSIGERLVKNLPASDLQFKYYVVDLPDVNAFVLVGGRIMVTRKLISFAKSEDELAGVIAHELGHAVVRHGAIDMSKTLKEALGITQVGDRAQIFETYNQFLDKQRTFTRRRTDNHENNQQLEADKIGMYAMMAAGYDPDIYTAFWTRFTEAKQTNFFSSLFGSSRPVDKRLKEMITAIRQTPSGCFAKLQDSTGNFEKWRIKVINYSGLGNTESLPALASKTKLEPLRSDINHLRFSPNGKYLIAQDTSSVTVLTVSPFSVLFRFDAEDALHAEFTADSEYITFSTKSRRVEKWNISTRSLVAVHEVALNSASWQTFLSPDGNILASYQKDGDLVLFRVEDGTEIYRVKRFYIPTYFEYLLWTFYMDLLDLTEISALGMKFSPDSKYFLAGRRVDVGFYDRQKTLALDLTTGKTISIGGNVKKLLFHSFAFMGNDKLVGQIDRDITKSGIFSFPKGDRLDQFEVGGTQLQKAHDTDMLIVRPVKGAAVAAFDIKSRRYTIGNKKSAFDLHGKLYVSERKTGELGLYTVGKTEPDHILLLPQTTFGNLRTISVSDNGKWLAVSDRSRGAVWDLENGERKFHLRSFSGSYIDDNGVVLADFPKHEDVERSLVKMNPKDSTAAAIFPVPNMNSSQSGKYLISRRPKTPNVKKENNKNEQETEATEEERQESIGNKNTIVEIRDVADGKLLWSRHFDFESPRFFTNDASNDIVMAWKVKTKAAQAIIKLDQTLAKGFADREPRDEDYLLQFVDAKTGSEKGRIIIDTGDGSIGIRHISLVDERVIISDTSNRILVYSKESARPVQRFFGRYSSLLNQKGIIAVANVPGRVTIYDLNSGEEIKRLSFLKPLSLIKFLPDGSRLFILTIDQQAFFFDVNKLVTK